MKKFLLANYKLKFDRLITLIDTAAHYH